MGTLSGGCECETGVVSPASCAPIARRALHAPQRSPSAARRVRLPPRRSPLPKCRAPRIACILAQPVIRAPHIARAPALIARCLSCAPAPGAAGVSIAPPYIMLVSLSATLSVPASEMLFTNTTFWMPWSRTKAGMFSLE